MSNRINGLGYDAAGNITSDPMTGGTMTYDAENRLLTAINGGVSGSYTYDADGRRVRLVTGGQETWYVYGIGGELLAEYAAAAPGVEQKEYGYRNGQLLVVWDNSETGDRKLQWLVQDHLGSTRMVVDRSGSLAGVRRHDFAPFGEELFAGAAIRSESNGYGADMVRQKFGSKERDIETGLDFFEARYLGSAQGRFTSVDPREIVFETNRAKFLAYIGNPQNWNRYSYVLNNPLVLSDPDGREPNKAQAGTVQQVIAIIQQIERNNPTATRTEVLERTAEHFRTQVDTPGNVRYVYTNNSGWIDAKHFFQAAVYGAAYGEAITNSLGLGVEISQTLSRDDSAFSYEDLGSNSAGADFGDDVFNPGGGLLSDQVANYFNNNLGATIPQAAPNFQRIHNAYVPGEGSRTSQASGSRTPSTRSANDQSQSTTRNIRSSTSHSAGRACPNGRGKPCTPNNSVNPSQ